MEILNWFWVFHRRCVLVVPNTTTGRDLNVVLNSGNEFCDKHKKNLHFVPELECQI